MAGYFDTYGATDQIRERRTNRIVLVVAGAAVLALALFLILHNLREKRAVNHFLDDVRAGNYQEAYALWGCTAATPCRDYKFDKFMEDWGPKGQYANIKAAKIPIVDSCGDGVVFTLEIPNIEPVGIWVDRATKTLGFAPWPRCPGRHWHFWEFIQRQFG
jgi:hypothetical protein